jgi:hypothetical protein
MSGATTQNFYYGGATGGVGVGGAGVAPYGHAHANANAHAHGQSMLPAFDTTFSQSFATGVPAPSLHAATRVPVPSLHAAAGVPVPSLHALTPGVSSFAAGQAMHVPAVHVLSEHTQPPFATSGHAMRVPLNAHAQDPGDAALMAAMAAISKVHSHLHGDAAAYLNALHGYGHTMPIPSPTSTSTTTASKEESTTKTASAASASAASAVAGVSPQRRRRGHSSQTVTSSSTRSPST